MTDRKKPSAALWITVALVVALMAYPLSFGPACWIASHCGQNQLIFESAYIPLIWIANRKPSAWDLLRPYAKCGMPDDGLIYLPQCGDSGSYFIDRDRFFVLGRLRRR